MPVTRRKRQIASQKNTERIAPRFSPEEKAMIKAAALKQRLTVSHFAGDVLVLEAEKILGMTLDEFTMIHPAKPRK